MAGTFVTVFQLALLWFLQTWSCQCVWTMLLYLPTDPLFFYPAVKVFQAPENQSKDQHCRALSRDWLGISSLLVLLRCCTTSGIFLSFWQFIFPSIYYRKAFRGVLCSEGIHFQKAPGFHIRRLAGSGGTRLLLIHSWFLHSARLHRGNILLPILGSAWPGSQLQHSNMLKSKMHMP